MAKRPYKIGFPKARVRTGGTPTGTMNRTEQRYANLLEVQRLAGEIASWHYEAFRLRLGENWRTTWNPDFMVILSTGEIELVDVKGGGGMEDDARVKIKAAARLYPRFWYVVATYKAKSWHREVVNVTS